MLHTLLVQRCKQVCRLFLIQIDGFLVLVLRQNHAAARIGKDKLPLNRCAQHGRNQPVMVQNRAYCKCIFLSGRQEHLIERELQCRYNFMCTCCADIGAACNTVQHIDGHACLFCQCPLCHAALFEQGFEVNRTAIARILTHAAFTEIIVKFHQVMRLQLVKANMADCGIDARHEQAIPRNCRRPQLLFSVVREPLFRKLGKLDITVQNLTVSALLLEQHRLPVEFLLQLALGHARLGCPCQVTAYLFAVQVIAARNRYFVAVAALLDGCHGQSSFSDTKM